MPPKKWIVGQRPEVGRECKNPMGRPVVDEFSVPGASPGVRLRHDERWVNRRFKPDRAYREWGVT